MAGTIQGIAEGIDDIRVAVWDERGTLGKVVIAVLLIVTGAAIPLVPIAFVARRIAR
jgi:phage-related minor tail protein